METGYIHSQLIIELTKILTNIEVNQNIKLDDNKKNEIKNQFIENYDFAKKSIIVEKEEN